MASVLLVNLPHARRVQRRMVASYEAPNFLVPPLELMGLAALLARQGHDAWVVDAIAEGLDVTAVASRGRPDWIIALTGFAILADDLATLAALRGHLPGARTAVFGYLPTVRPAEIARHSGVDVVIVGEPEDTAVELVDRGLRTDTAGLCWVDGDGVHHTPPRPRIRDLDRLPYADHRLVPLARYHEPFVDGPIGAMITARGCPHRCTFCVKPYGDEVVSRSLAHLLGEVDALAELGVRHLRFLDDTWALSRPRALALCEALRGRHPTLRWTCLTRLDSLDPGLTRAMAQAGCRRIYAGVESADPDRLAAWRKGTSPDALIRGARAARAEGIELSGFFVVGAPGDRPADVRASVELARRLDLDFVIATRLQVWPGTPLHEATFGDAPGPADGALPGADWVLERAFYRDFYLHPRGWSRHLRRLRRAPVESARGALAVARYVTWPHRRDLI